ncbi:uncharacterized protein N7459_004812 [Penicillium hispanicum]|uniref:uncharacterized protein n=1 Tax=Penicillium hispanicum TaxID=1080232 RepID=UPI00253FE4C8|nr:uncharacterized protein N7459_004812 [Penicillium hispanicum]KAJ5585012.1 hypothetical protein N7459_004812 [Penicillium hispanicum]
MRYFTRSSVRRPNSQPAETAKPHQPQQKSPRRKRANFAQIDNAPVNGPVAQTIQTVWEEPPLARARPTWADADSTSTPQDNEILKTMKPIGQYPSVAEYKSVGLTPPPKDVRKRHLELASRTDDSEDPMTDIPITPVAEETILSDAPRIDDEDEPFSGVENSLDLKGTGETVASEDVVNDVDDAIDTTNLATPVSEALGLQTVHHSLSPVDTPLDTPADEVLTDPILTAPPTHLTAPDLETPLHQTQTPPATAFADGMASESENVASRDYVAVLNSLPDPPSKTYDVHQLKKVVEHAISHSVNLGDDDVALSLVHFWSDIDSDDFKLSLIHNIGRNDTDHNLELALRTMLRHSVGVANAWYKTYTKHQAMMLARHDSGSESSLSSAKSLEAETLGQSSFKVADIYRDTSGPKLEEAFVSGKTNTAPLKRPKKPCRVNENSFKRRRDWEADPTMEESLREKRARLAKMVEPDNVLAMDSSLRPQRGQPEAIEQSHTHDSDEEAPASPSASRSQRSPQERRKQKQKEKEKRRQQEQERRMRSRPSTSRGRSLSVDTTISVNSAASNSCYSDRVNEWDSGFPRRQMPNSIEPPENIDNCYKCDGGGELLCCDTCENAFHFRCLRPAMDPKNPPKGEWFCPKCNARNSFTTAIAYGKHKKKTEYSPPTDIKEYFAGVGERIQFDPLNPTDLKNQRYYTPVPHLPRLTKPPKQPVPTPAYNDPNLLKLMENGHVILCNRCGKSSGGDRPIIRCDYCPSRFHLDCLDPPLANPPNPRTGWMCPNHVRPDDMIITKMVDGHLHERRVRRPKGAVAVDVDILASDDHTETTFDEEWREKRVRLPAGDLVLNFVTAVREDSQRREREYFKRVAETAVTIAKQLTREALAGIGVPSSAAVIPAQGLPAGLAQNINDAVQNMQSGTIPDEQYEAAASLLSLSRGPPISTVGVNQAVISSDAAEPASTPDEVAAAAQQEEAAPAVAASIKIGDSEEGTSDAQEPPVLNTRSLAASPSRQSSRRRKAPSANRSSKSDTDTLPRTRASLSRVSRKTKRTRTESSDPAGEEEPAQKRQHTDSD